MALQVPDGGRLLAEGGGTRPLLLERELGAATRLSLLCIAWPGAWPICLGDVAAHAPRSLTRLVFWPGTTVTVAGELHPGHLQALRNFELADCTLSFSSAKDEAAWLPPSLTLLHLAGAGLQRLPPVLGRLPALRW